MDQVRISAGGVNVQILSIVMVSNASMIYTNESNYTTHLGTLSLPGLATYQSFSYSSGKVAPVNASLLLGYLWEQHLILSSSFGMYLGVAAFGPSLSLWLRG